MKITYLYFWLQAICICILSMQAHSIAQNIEPEEMVIESTRLTSSIKDAALAISVVSEQEIQLGRQQLALDEALAGIPGLFMQNRYNFAQDLRISIRGFGARSAFGIRGIKIISDGIPLTVADGQGQVDTIDLGASKRIEVIRGPSSALYGNASGGVISVTSEDGPETPFVSMRISGGDYGYHKMAIKTGGKTDQLNYFMSLSDSNSEGYREHSESKNTQFTGRVNLDINDDSSLLFTLNHTDQPTSNDPGGITLAQAASEPDSAYVRNVLYQAGESVTQTRLGLVYSSAFGHHGEITVRGYLDSRNFFSRLPQFPVADAVELDRDLSGYGVTYTHNDLLGSMAYRILAGIDIDRQEDDRKRFINNQGGLGNLVFDQTEEVAAKGVFLQGNLELNPNLLLSLGARYDNIKFSAEDHYLIDGNDSGSRRLDNFSPMLGLVYQHSPDTSFYGNLSTSFETPTTTEFTNPSGGGFNPNIEPQQATNYEIGARGSFFGQTQYQLSLFHIKASNELIPYDLDGRSYYRNAGESIREGMEFFATSNLGENLKLTLSTSYGKFEFDDFHILTYDSSEALIDVDDFSGQRIPGVVEKQFFAELLYTDPNGLYSAISLNYTGDLYGDNGNSVKIDAYALVNWRLGADFKLGNSLLSPFIGINNLTSEDYFSNIRINAFGGRYYEPAPKRNAYAGLEFRIDY